MSAVAGIRTELAELYARREVDAAELDRVHTKYVKIRAEFESAQRKVERCTERIEVLADAWRLLTTDDLPTPGTVGAPS